MAAPKQHGAGYPGVPTTPMTSVKLTVQGILPKAGPNKVMSRSARMPTPVSPVYKTPNKSSGGRVKTTSAGSAKKGTTSLRLGF